MVKMENTVIRDNMGRFVPGTAACNPGGRPIQWRARVREIRQVLVTKLQDGEWGELVEAQQRKAAQGDTDAFRALLSFLPQQVDVGGQEDNPLLSPDAVLTAILDARDRLRGALPATEADVRMLPSPSDDTTVHGMPEYTDGAGI
jgi:hypothetical protein